MNNNDKNVSPITVNWDGTRWAIELEGVDITDMVAGVNITGTDDGRPPLIMLEIPAQEVQVEGRAQVLTYNGEQLTTGELADAITDLDPDALEQIWYSGDMATKPAQVMTNWLADWVRAL